MRSGMSKIDRVRRGEMDTGYIHLPSIYTHGEKEKDGGAMSEGDTEKMEMAQKRDQMNREEETKNKYKKILFHGHFSY